MNARAVAARLLPGPAGRCDASLAAGRPGGRTSVRFVGSEAALATARPGLTPKQPIDEEYTKKIKEYTTETFFLSPLVDYMPASKTVPTPKAMLGDIAGAPGKLPVLQGGARLHAPAGEVDAAGQGLQSIGTTEEGREMIAVAVASEALLSRLEPNKADLSKLADPRTIKMDDDAGRRRSRGARRRSTTSPAPSTPTRPAPRRRSWSWPTGWRWTRARTSGTSASTSSR